jgi:molecular chaperone DnaK
MVYQVEKTLNDNADKIADDVQAEVREGLKEAKEALEKGEVASIKSATERLERSSHRMAEQIYKSQAEAGAGAGAGGPSAGQQGADDVIDAEVVETEEGSS